MKNLFGFIRAFFDLLFRGGKIILKKEDSSPMKLSDRQSAFTLMVARFILWVYKHPGWTLTFGEAWRPPEMQKIYFEQGKTEIKQGGKHSQRLAIDFNFFINRNYQQKPQPYRPLGEYWEKLGGCWGGRFGVRKEDYKTRIGWDPNHFEL